MNTNSNAPAASESAAPAKATKLQDTYKYRVMYSTPWGVLTTRNGDGYFTTIEEAAYVAAQLNERLAKRGRLNQFEVAAERHYPISGEHHMIAAPVIRIGNCPLEWYEYSVADYSAEAWEGMDESQRIQILADNFAMYPAFEKK